ncbi:MAG: glycosyltransferase family 4 protein [Candidatus Hydrogenedentota bacterium]
MRIGIDMTPLNRGRSGVGHFLFYQLKHLMQVGEAHVWRGLASGMRSPVLDDLDGALPCHYLPIPTRLLYHAWSTLGAPRADMLVHGVDVFHATNYFLPPVRTARRVLTLYDLAFLKTPELVSPKIVGPFSKHVPRFAAQADHILTCSEASKGDIVRLLGVPEEKVSVAHGAVDKTLAPVPRSEAVARVIAHYGVEVPFVLFVGTLEPRKNIEGLLRAFARLADTVPHQLVLIGGRGWSLPPVAAMAAELGIAQRVTWLGYLPDHRDLPAFYSAADCFVLPSWYEGFGLPVIEAMACGCPVVTSPVASLPEVGGEAAHYADPASPEDIAAAVLGVLCDGILREQMRAAGRAQAAGFTWEGCARATLDVYQRLV